MNAADRLFGALPALLANAALDLDPVARAQLARLEGRRLRIECTAPPLSTDLIVAGSRLAIDDAPAAPPNVILRGSVRALVSRLFGGEHGSGAIEVDGDASTLTEFEAVLRALRPDPALSLGRVASRELAETLVGGAELAFAALRSAAAGLSAEGKRRAARRWTARAGYEVLRDELDELALATDRLEARIALAERRAEEDGS